MSTPLTDRIGSQQGRIIPENHTPAVTDNPSAAVLTSLLSGPFALSDGVQLLVSVDQGLTQTVTFLTADFSDIGAATASEVAAVIGSTLTGAGSTSNGDAVDITTEETGPDASLRVIGGTANNALQFPTSAVGTQGIYSFVMGSDVDRTVILAGGDRIAISQEGDFSTQPTDAIRVGGGVVRLPETPLPSGYAWLLAANVDGSGSPVVRDLTTDADTNGWRSFSISDFGIAANTAVDAPGSHTFEVSLELDGPTDPVSVALPAIYLDYLTLTSEQPLFLIDRYPAPDQDRVPHTLEYLRLTLAFSEPATGPDLADIQVYVGGVLAYDSSGVGFQTGFDGAHSSSSTGGLEDTSTVIVVDLTELTYTDEQAIPVRVVAEELGGGGFNLDETYSFSMADIDQPQITSVSPQEKSVIRVTFNEDMRMDAASSGALNPANYTIVAQSSPAVSVVPIAVTEITSSVVEVALDIETTIGATYDLTVGPLVEDDDGNVIDPSLSSTSFVGFRPPQPSGRNFQVWDFWPTFNQSEDEAGSGDLRKMSLIFQDTIDLLLCSVDEWTSILDPDFAPSEVLDAMLRDSGNPFPFQDLSEIDKRRLIRTLVDIYKEKGTEVGIINAVRFFVGVEITLDVINRRSYWRLGVATLGVDTILGPGDGDPLLYSFSLVSPVTLTDTQRSRMLQIADYMKSPHEHILGIIEPGQTDAVPSFWALGVSLLGVDTVLQ